MEEERLQYKALFELYMQAVAYAKSQGLPAPPMPDEPESLRIVRDLRNAEEARIYHMNKAAGLATHGYHPHPRYSHGI